MVREKINVDNKPRYAVRNWERFQHYNKPRPAWIKLHRTLLDDHDFQSLSTRSRALLVMLWLIAAESENGTIPSEEAIAWRLRLPIKEITSDIRTLTHYLEPLYDDSRVVLASDRDREETETETDKLGTSPSSKKPEPVFSGKKMVVSASDHEKLVAVYDERLAMAEYPKADLWLQNNPQRRRSNVGRFMASWLERAASRAPKGGGPSSVVYGQGGNFV